MHTYPRPQPRPKSTYAQIITAICAVTWTGLMAVFVGHNIYYYYKVKPKYEELKRKAIKLAELSNEQSQLFEEILEIYRKKLEKREGGKE